MPLAHILAPQLALKAQEIEDELGHAPVGYLDVGNVGAGGARSSEGPALPKMRKGETASEAGLRELRAQPQKTPAQTFRNAVIAGAMNEGRRQKYLQPIPNYAAPAPEPAAPAKTDKRGRIVISAADLNAPGAMVNEYGEPVDKRGKKTGYLKKEPLRPDMANPEFSPAHAYKFGGESGAAEIRRRYSEHAKAMQYDPGTGDMRFPSGYFDGMSKKQIADIKAGVEALQALDRPISI